MVLLIQGLFFLHPVRSLSKCDRLYIFSHSHQAKAKVRFFFGLFKGKLHQRLAKNVDLTDLRRLRPNERSAVG